MDRGGFLDFAASALQLGDFAVTMVQIIEALQLSDFAVTMVQIID